MKVTMNQGLKELKCRRCSIIKPLTEFVKDNYKPLGYRRLCKKCMSQEIKTLGIRRKNEQLCVRCGKPSKQNSVLCIECSEKDTKRMCKKRKENKKRAVIYLGEKCFECGLKSNIYDIYDFHHNNKNKEYGLAHEMGHSWEKLKKELDKCGLLCANCHRIKHWKLKNGN